MVRRDTFRVQASHGSAAVFDEGNLVSWAGLVPVLRLADRSGLSELLSARLSVVSPNAAVKARTVIAGMLAGADDIDGLDVLRSGSTARVVPGVRAPSTIGTFLRAFTHGHVLQLAAVNRRLVAAMAGDVPGLVGGGGGDLVLVDMDDTIRRLYGYAKQAVAYGYSKVKGLNGLVATVSTDTSAPVVTDFGLRRGNVKSGDSAEWYAKRTLATVAGIAPGRKVLLRADSAFCSLENVQAALAAGAWFSFTIPAWPTVTRAIAAIDEATWTSIKYPHAVYDEQAGGWTSDAQVAEAPFTAFVSHPKNEQVACRLVVRRVKRLGDKGQGELFDAWRYHAFITNSTLDTVTADERHRAHAIVEQVMAELKGGPLAHLPSGVFTANAAWLAFAVIAFNISRAAAHAAGMGKVRMATVLARITRAPARLARRARRHTLHLPTRWPWQTQWARLWDTATSPPDAAAA